MTFLIQIVDEILSEKWLLFSLILFGFAIIFVLGTRVFVRFKFYHDTFTKIKNNFDKIQLKFRETVCQKNNLFLLKFGIFKKVYEDLEIIFSENIAAKWNKALIITFLGLVSLFGLFFLATTSVFLSLIIESTLVAGLVFVVLRVASSQRKKMVIQIPMFLTALGNTLEAGYSLSNAFTFIEKEIPDPLQAEVRKISQKLKLQVPLEKALHDFADSVDHKDVRFFAESTAIQLKIGGNLIQLFQQIGSIIEERLKLERDLKSFTSQGRISGILVAGLFPASLFLFYLLSPAHIDVLFHTGLGKVFLGTAISFEIIGFFFIWKIVNVKF